MLKLGSGLWKVEIPHEEDRHLITRDGTGRAVLQRAGYASSCDTFTVKLLDPICGPVIAGNISENARGGGRRVGAAVAGAQQEDGHLVTGDGHIGAVQHGRG